MKQMRYKRKVAKKATKAKMANKQVATKAYVNRLMHVKMENKYFVTYSTGTGSACYVQSNSAPTLGNNLINLIPPIPQSTTIASNSTRQGNQVNIVKSRINLVFSMLPYNATTNPYTPSIFVKLWVVRYKTDNANVPTLSNWQSFFDLNGTNTSFSGSTLDLEFRVSDLFEVYKTKTLWLTCTSNSANTVPNATSYGFSSGRANMRCSFDLTKALGKKLLYNDNNTSSVIGKNLWLVIQPICAYNSVSTGNTIAPVFMTYAQHTDFEDP